MRISDWSSDVCSSDLDAGDPHDVEQLGAGHGEVAAEVTHDGAPRCGEALVDELLEDRDARPTSGAGLGARLDRRHLLVAGVDRGAHDAGRDVVTRARSEEHTSELQSLMRISYAVFCLKKKNITTQHITPFIINQLNLIQHK